MFNVNFDSWIEYFGGLMDEKTRVRYKKKYKGGGECKNRIFKVLLFLIIIACVGAYMLK